MPLTTFPFTPGFVHGTTAAYPVEVHRFVDQSEQRYLRSRTPRETLRYEFTYPSSSLVAQVTSFFLGMGGPETIFEAMDHRTREPHPVRFAGAALTHTRGGVMRGLSVDFVYQSTVSMIPAATAYVARSSAEWCDTVTAGSGVVFPPPGPPAPFLGVQAPEGADLLYWQSVASFAGVGSYWKVTGTVRGDFTTNANFIGADQRLFAMPLIQPRSTTLLGIGVFVTGAGAGGEVARLSLWAARSLGDLYPGSRVADFGTVTLASIGLQAVTTSIALHPNVYYFAGFVTSGFASAGKDLRVLGQTVTPYVGVASYGFGGAVAVLGWSIPAGMTLPATYPDNASPVLHNDINAPAFAYRIRE